MHKLISVVTRMLVFICLAVVACSSQETMDVKTAPQEAQVTPTDDFITVSGSVAYLQRIAMPPDALLRIRIEDVSRADTSAPVLAEISEPFGARQVPIKFSLKVPSAAIDGRMAYAVRATITVNGKLRFTTTRNYAVLSRGAANNVDLVLDAVHKKDSSNASPSNNVSFTLPATFAGVVPCADCAGIEQTLTLLADGQYRLRSTYVGKPDGTFTELGRWEVDASDKQLTLRSGEQTRLFSVTDDATLRLLDQLGQPIKSTANLDLRRKAQVDPISEQLHLRDEGRVSAELKDTYWKLIELDSKKITMAPTQAREVRITLASEDSRLIAFGGCNQLAGSYVLDGSKLKFTQMIGTLMACVSPFMELESNVLKMLGTTTSYQIDDEQLTLLGGDQVLARFEAVYLK